MTFRIEVMRRRVQVVAERFCMDSREGTGKTVSVDARAAATGDEDVLTGQRKKIPG